MGKGKLFGGVNGFTTKASSKKDKKQKNGTAALVPTASTSTTPIPVVPGLTEDEIKALYTPDEYICTLSPELKTLAADELNETDRKRYWELLQLRTWIGRVNYIPDCRLDSNFLLRFLRVKKFNHLISFDMLINYITMRQNNPAWFRGLSLNDPVIRDLIDRGVIFALPERDMLGRRVIFSIGGNIDPSIHTAEDVMRTLLFITECFLEDEENQIRGMVHIFDESDVRMAHIQLFQPREIHKILKNCEQSLPVRHKQVDFIALPKLLQFTYEVACRILISRKLRSRIHLHSNRSALAKAADGATSNLDRKILPAEYGGTVPVKDMIAAFKTELLVAGGGRTLARVAALDRLSVDVELMKRAGKDSLDLLIEDLDAIDELERVKHATANKPA